MTGRKNTQKATKKTSATPLNSGTTHTHSPKVTKRKCLQRRQNSETVNHYATKTVGNGKNRPREEISR